MTDEQNTAQKRAAYRGLQIVVLLVELFAVLEFVVYHATHGENTLHGAIRDYWRDQKTDGALYDHYAETRDKIRDLPETDQPE